MAARWHDRRCTDRQTAHANPDRRLSRDDRGCTRAVGHANGWPPPVVKDVHLNPNAGHREVWFKAVDGYTIVLAGSDGYRG